MIKLKQITTPTTLPTAERNAIVRAAGIQCQAIDCELRATRWSNLCGLCERKFLEGMKPVFGKPTKEQLGVAQKLLRKHFAGQLANGVFADWASQVARTMSHPEGLLISPLALKRRTRPKERYVPLLALRTRDRGLLTVRGVIALLAYALVIDATITPLIPQPVRSEYMIALLGQRFMRREVYSQKTSRIRMKRVSTGIVRYGSDGPEEVTQLVDEEVPSREFCRIRRSDMRYIGRRLWALFEMIFIAGGRGGPEWQSLQDAYFIENAPSDSQGHVGSPQALHP